MNRGILMAVMVFASSLAYAGGSWFTEAGPWYRGGMKMDVSGGSIDAGNEIGMAAGGNVVSVPSGQLLNDDGAAQQLRQFDNGYVGPSGWGWARDDGITQYWAYDDASQYDSGSGTLRFKLTLSDSGSADRELSRVVAGDRAWKDSQTANGTGGQVTLGRVLQRSRTREWSGVLQAGWLQDIGWTAQHRFDDRLTVEHTTYRSAYQRREEWTYTYDTLSNPAFPSAPYAMTDNSGTGPMISDRPASIQRNGAQQVSYSDRVVGSRQVLVHSDVSVDADALLLVFNLGPRFRWTPSSRWSLVLQAGVTANMLDAEVERREIFSQSGGQVLQADILQVDERAWLAGASASCGFQFNLNDSFYVLASGGYDYVEPHEFSVGPDRITLDLSGYSANVAFGMRFF